jgi:hypothetical protein
VEIKHILELRDGDFNVPVHVLNPHQKYRGEICSTLREYVFNPLTKVILLVGMKKGPKQFRSLHISEASLIAMAMEKRGYETMIMEQPEYEFFGRATWEPGRVVGLPGSLTVDKGCGAVTQTFAFVESIPEVRLRSIARLVMAVQGYLDAPGIEIEYVWSTNFVGVKQLKLIIYDYKFLSHSS